MGQGGDGIQIHGLSANDRRRTYKASTRAREEVLVFRRVWTHEECDRVVEAVRRCVERKGTGWASKRHAAFPTVDVPAYELSPRAFGWVKRAVRNKVLPKFAARHGLDVADLYFKDLFFVLYDADSADGQRELALHHDGSLFSFNILLNEASEFLGGGTLFPQLGVVKINKGDLVMHDGKVMHGGAPVTKGKRIILVGFVETNMTEQPSFGESIETENMRLTNEVKAIKQRASTSTNRHGQEDVIEDLLAVFAFGSAERGADCDGKEEDLDPVTQQDTVEALRVVEMDS